jgi:hypothetical protein
LSKRKVFGLVANQKVSDVFHVENVFAEFVDRPHAVAR